jgi:hypothetical protein
MALPRTPPPGIDVTTSTSGNPVPQEENKPVHQHFPSPISFPPSNQAEQNQDTTDTSIPTSGNPVPQEENKPVKLYFPSPIFFPPSNQVEQNQDTTDTSVPLSINNMDTSHHQILYAQGLEIRKKVVGEDYVANALEKGGSDFLRPLQQFATVCLFLSFLPFHPVSISVEEA